MPDVGWLDIKFKYYLQMLKFYNRVLSMNVDRLTRQALDFSNNDWSGHILKILKVLDKEENFDNHEKI